MAVWSVIVIVVLFVILIVFGILNVVTARNNQILARKQILLPFSATIDPTTGQETGFMNIDGTPQIKCPVGTKVNIVGAFFNVFDPYNECAAKVDQVNPFLAFMCNPAVQGVLPSSSGQTTCSGDQDCPYYMNPDTPFFCNPNTKMCQLKPTTAATCSTVNFDMVNIGGSKYCVERNLCGTNIKNVAGTGVPNPACSPSNSSAKCAIRDASANVAAVCDGRQDCSNLKMADFGDLPCGYTPKACISGYTGSSPDWITSTGTNSRSDYCALPYLPGYSGGLPSAAASSDSPVDPNSNVGYTMHGIYTCVLE